MLKRYYVLGLILSSTLMVVKTKGNHLAITWCIVCQGETTTTILKIRWSYPNMVFVNFIKHLPSMLEAPWSLQHCKIFPYVLLHHCLLLHFLWILMLPCSHCLFSHWFWNYLECYNSIILFFVLMSCVFF